MLSIAQSSRVFLCVTPTDMRKSFDSLAALVAEELGGDPFSGHWFVFRSKRGDRVKILAWDRDGLTLYYKRLEEGVFRFPSAGDPKAKRFEVTAEELSLLLWGIELSSVRRQKRYHRPVV